MRNKEFGKFLRDLRYKHSINRQTLAYKLGVSEVTVWRWEEGRAFPSRKHLAELMRMFPEVPQTEWAMYLLGGTEDGRQK